MGSLRQKTIHGSPRRLKHSYSGPEYNPPSHSVGIVVKIDEIASLGSGLFRKSRKTWVISILRGQLEYFKKKKKFQIFNLRLFVHTRPEPNVLPASPPYDVLSRFSWNNSDKFSPEYPACLCDTQNITLISDRPECRFVWRPEDAWLSRQSAGRS